MLQLLGNLLNPPQRLLRLQLLQAEQGQAQLVLLGVGRGGISWPMSHTGLWQ